MLILFLWAIIFIASVGLLVKSADMFTGAAEKLGKFFGMSSFITGVLIVSFGTSLPELATSISSVLQGATEIVAANIFGSNIANGLLALGIAAIICKGIVRPKWNIFYGDFPILVAGTIFCLFSIQDGIINRYESILFLAGLALYFFYLKEIHLKNNKKKERKIKKKKFDYRNLILLALSLVGILAAAKYCVASVINIALFTGLGASVLAAALIAIGTSLPEISVAISAVKKKNWDLLVGDVIGSNVFNIFAIFGISGIIAPLIIAPEIMLVVVPFLVASLVLTWVVLADKKITTSEGILMVMFYVFFIGKLFGMF
jgi:cation:H+ antiporter